jgi:SulP family sulfate permease
MASSVEVKKSEKQELADELSEQGVMDIPSNVLVYTIEGPFFFAAVENFERALAATSTYPETLIIGLKWVPFIDVTGLQTLEEVIQDLQRNNVRVIISGANGRVSKKLYRAGIFNLVGIENHCTNLKAAVKAAG